ncbi:MAG TPA: antibiotic biosynthesis monooxygenase [Candidatus Dormibacteraeota bacterium]|nr:antibiotic biosynthesis monooxygenase [Candidatus Dormibacteraeota bacterium]
MRSEGVTLINAFEVPPEADELFVAGWERAREFLAAREGFSATALHRALRPDAEFRFVNVARVDSHEASWQAMGDPAFPGGEMPFTAHAGVYEVVHEDGNPDGGEGVVLISAFEVRIDDDEGFLAG